MKNGKLRFTYKTESGCTLSKKYVFRPGDLVEVKDWGENYDTFYSAFKAFGFEEQKSHGYNTYEQRWSSERPKVFKFVAALEHPTYGGRIICHIRSMMGHNFVISLEGLKPVKVYPLRKLKGETTTVDIKRLKR
jgi:hypothetical protein